MADRFYSIHFNVASGSDVDVETAGARPLARRGGRAPRASASSSFANEEAAARFYLSNILGSDARPSVRGLTAPDRSEVVPDLKLVDTKTSKLTKNFVVRFVQTKAAIPIFGSRAVVEMDRRRELLGADAQLTEVDNIPHLAAFSPAQALAKIVAIAPAGAAIDRNSLNAPHLTFFHDDDKDKWHLVWYFRNIPVAPEAYLAGLKSHGALKAMHGINPQLDYLVDAHDGRIVLYWSSSPTIGMPVACTGTDEDGINRAFFGERGPNATFILSDPMRKIKTFDFGGGDIAIARAPSDPISNANTTFNQMPAAISAHFNAKRVYDFWNDVLKRRGIDDAGMELLSYVNCTYSQHQPGPEWQNAVWHNKKMWYGQVRDGDGNLRSTARHLDIMAHELAHGVTQSTADLMYFRQSGALNESFSDIFGLIVKNWDITDPDNGGVVKNWNWEIGPGWAEGGLPLRDMTEPTRTGEPDHMNKFVETDADNGGVHTNSNIHNKAAYNLLTAENPDGTPVFTPNTVAILYYLTLGRLSTTATFQKTLTTLLNVAEIFLSGQKDKDVKLAAIVKAYASVGIEKKAEKKAGKKNEIG